jgi:hypothetical protein
MEDLRKALLADPDAAAVGAQLKQAKADTIAAIQREQREREQRERQRAKKARRKERKEAARQAVV